MAFKEMDPDEVWKLIAGQENLLAPLIEKEKELLSTTPCPNCNGEAEAFVDRKRPFSPGMVLPNKLLRCLRCKAEFHPKTGIILSPPINLEQD